MFPTSSCAQRVCIQAIQELHELGALDDCLKPVYSAGQLQLRSWMKEAGDGTNELECE